jgi:pimeloyl-ACP methyl ester carboxylesterase
MPLYGPCQEAVMGKKLGFQKQGGDAPPKRVAIVFVHGFTGDRMGTWRRIPEFLSQEPRLAEWDLVFFGYPSSGFFDLLNVWSSDPDLEAIATQLSTAEDLLGYDALAFVAHSMGGLVVQRALVRSEALRQRTRHVVLFGTPSGGLDKARRLAFWKQQIRNMSSGSKFIGDLRADWKRLRFNQDPPFTFLAVAGLEDQFVPIQSSLGPFPEKFQTTIDGNHITMLKAASAGAECVQKIVQQIAHTAAAEGPLTAARLAVQKGKFDEVVRRLTAVRDDLTDSGAVELALALDALGRRSEAMELLEQHKRAGTDVLGVLGGRYKRRWVAESRRSDFKRAVQLYQQGYDEAVAKQDHAQAFYLGINLAYLALAGETRDGTGARRMAKAVLMHCDETRKDETQKLWRLASEGDAYLVLKDFKQALARHREAAKLKMDPWQALSIQEQALRLAGLTGMDEAGLRKLSGYYQGKQDE